MICIFFSCSNQREKTTALSKIDINSLLKECNRLTFQTIDSALLYTDYWTNQECVFTSQEIIIVDKKGKQVLCFDNTGKFLCKIGKEGQGPGEFSGGPQSIFLSQKGEIYISDATRIHVFSGDKKHVSTTELGISIDPFKVIDTFLVYLDNAPPGQWLLVNKYSGGKEREIFRYKKNMPRLSSHTSVFFESQKEDTLFIMLPIEYTMLKLTSTGNLLNTNSSYPYDFTFIDKDINDDDARNSGKTSTILRSISNIYSMSVIGDYIFVQWVNTKPPRMHIDIYNTNFFHIASVNNITTSYSLHDNENLYAIQSPEGDSAGKYSNPVLRKFQINFSLLDSIAAFIP